MQSWFVVYTQPREEHIAEENLARQGYDAYWPRYRKRVAHARKVREVSASLFPRYAFDPLVTGWRNIRSTRGCIDVIRNGFDPTPVPNALVTSIRAREDEQGCVVLGKQAEFVKGQHIKLKGDAFQGQSLIFETMKDNDRVVVLMTLLGREFKVEVPVANVAPVSMA